MESSKQIRRLILTLSMLFALTIGAYAQKRFELDLAKHEPNKDIPVQTIAQGQYSTIILKNHLLKKEYEIEVELTQETIPPFPTGSYSSGPEDEEECKKLGDLTDDTEAAESEKEIGELKEKIAKQLKSMSDEDQKKCKEAVKDAKLVLSAELIRKLVDEVRVTRCSKVTIHVIRDAGTDKEAKWTFILKGGCESPWKVHFGFTFAPNMMTPVREYYAKSDTGSTFLVTKKNNQGSQFLTNLTPTVMFTYRPYQTYSWKRGSEDFSLGKAVLSNYFYKLGFTGGIGFDLEKPMAMVGPSIVIKENLSLNAGVAFFQKQVLKGEYREGQRLDESLDFDQLHEERYMAEWFVSIGFRFDQNPFKKEEESD